MKKKIYIIIISVLAIVIASTAFIPLSHTNEIEEGKSSTKIVQNHPDAGYIEEIGK